MMDKDEDEAMMFAERYNLGEAMDFREDWIQSRPEMIPYYSSIDRVQKYHNSKMYEKIKQELGDDIFDEWDKYYDMKLQSYREIEDWRSQNPDIEDAETLRTRYFELKDVASVKKDAFWELHKPRLERYTEIRNDWYETKIDPYIKDAFGVEDPEKFRNEYKQAYVNSYTGDPYALQKFFDENPEYISVMAAEGTLRNMMYDEMRQELGDDIFDLWTAYEYNTDLAELEMKALSDMMNDKGYWDLLDEYTTFKDSSEKPYRDAIGENTKLSRYIELKKEYSQKATDDVLAVYEALKPAIWPDIRPDVLARTAMPVAEYMQESRTPGVFEYSWSDWQKELSPTMRNFVVDYAVGGEQMPEVAMSQIEYIAQKYNIDPYLALELMQRSLSR
jgi:hypothetical protein